MKKNDINNENVTTAHRKAVMDAVSGPLKDNRPKKTPLWEYLLTPSFGASFAVAALALFFYNRTNTKSPQSNNNLAINNTELNDNESITNKVLANHLSLDPELLYESEILMDLEILEELETLENWDEEEV